MQMHFLILELFFDGRMFCLSLISRFKFLQNIEKL